MYRLASWSSFYLYSVIRLKRTAKETVSWKQFCISYMPFINISEGIIYMPIGLSHPCRIPKTNRSATAWVLLLTAYIWSSDSLNWCMQICSVLHFSTLSFPTFACLLLGLSLCLHFQKLPFFSHYRCKIVLPFQIIFFFLLAWSICKIFYIFPEVWPPSNWY